MNIIGIINRHGEIKPERIAHITRGSSLTYGELVRKSDALAAYLIDKYRDDKTPVIVYGHKQHDMLICFLACVKAGHAYIPVDSSLPPERVQDIVANSRTKLIFNTELTRPESPASIGGGGQRAVKSSMDSTNIQWGLNIPLNEVTFNVTGLDTAAEPQNRPDLIGAMELQDIYSGYMGETPDPSFWVSASETYYIIYTSGSTGKPKGVQITRSCLQSFVRWALGICRLDPDRHYTFLNQAPFSFDLSVMDLYLALASGSTLFSLDKGMLESIKDLFAAFQASELGVWVSTPSFAELCLADRSFNAELLPRLELMLFCGEVLSGHCAANLCKRFPNVRVVNTYGPTEATVAVTQVDIDPEMCATQASLPVGYVKDDCKLLIVDGNGQSLPEGHKGEIVIVGDSVSPGYFNNEEMTGKVFGIYPVDGVPKRSYRTGDEGYLKEGLLYFCGRIDFQIKLHGYRIELEDIENNLRKLALVRNAVVLPVVQENKVQYLTAVITLHEKPDLSEFKLGMLVKNELKQLLPDYMIPKKIMIKDTIPMTVNGKINRAALLEEIG